MVMRKSWVKFLLRLDPFSDDTVSLIYRDDVMESAPIRFSLTN